MADNLKQEINLPNIIPIFPLKGVVMFPDTYLPLNIFEPRYLKMIEKAISTKNRLVGMIQPYNLNEDGEPGFDIINPINIENKNFLINRGWVKMDDKSKSFITNNENFVGIFREKSKSSYFKPENDLPNNYWFKLEDNDLEKYTGLIFSKYIIYLNDSNLTKIPKPKNISANLSNNHLKYALTWFSLAISIFLIYLYFRKKNY